MNAMHEGAEVERQPDGKRAITSTASQGGVVAVVLAAVATALSSIEF
jgi:hypothetical protein